MQPGAGAGSNPEGDAEKREKAEGIAWRSYVERGDTRALEAGSDAAGGFIGAPQVEVKELLRVIEDANFVRGLSRKFTITAESLGVPTLTPPSDAAWTSELLTGSADTTMAFGKRELRPHPLAKQIRVSNKLLRQATIDPVALVREEFGLTFASTEENAFLTGTGTLQPLGVFTASADGISTGRDSSIDNTNSSMTADGLMRVKYTLKSQYWGRAQWIFHRDGVRQIATLKDGEGRYLFDVGRNTLLGFPMNVSENAPNTFTTGLYVGILGDFNFYWIADALGFELQRLNELYAASNQTGFIGRKETDGAPVLEEAFVRVTLT